MGQPAKGPVGEACKRQVQHSIENARQLLADAYSQLELTWEGAQIQARKYFPFAQERYPQYREFLELHLQSRCGHDQPA